MDLRFHSRFIHAHLPRPALGRKKQGVVHPAMPSEVHPLSGVCSHLFWPSSLISSKVSKEERASLHFTKRVPNLNVRSLKRHCTNKQTNKQSGNHLKEFFEKIQKWFIAPCKQGEKPESNLRLINMRLFLCGLLSQARWGGGRWGFIRKQPFTL